MNFQIDGNPVIQSTAEFVKNLFAEKLPAKLVYHNLNHTSGVAEMAKKIGRKSGLSEDDIELVELAGWLHDVGYVETYAGHEEKSADIARNFLKGLGYPEPRIDKITELIMATKMPHSPRDILSEVICDADLAHLGTEDYLSLAGQLRNEWEICCSVNYSDQDWMKLGIEFLSKHRFFTPYARKKFEEQKNRNLDKLRKKYGKIQDKVKDREKKHEKLMFEREKLEVEKQKIAARKEETDLKAAIEKEKLQMKKDAEQRADRGVETMFRNTIRTHVEFSAMADSKANIMISINTLLIGIIVTTMIRKLDANPHLTIPTFILMGVSLVCIIFSVLVTRPKITSGIFTKEDIQTKRTNLLFFGNFFNMKLDDFNWGMKEMINDREYLYGSMIKDFYFLGQVLGKKYKYLRICYTIFMFGLVVAVISYVIAFLLNPGKTSLDLLQEL